MKLRYQNTIEDLVTFNRHCFVETPLFRRQVRQGRVVASIIMFAAGLSVYFILVGSILWRDAEEKRPWPDSLVIAIGLVFATAAAIFGFVRAKANLIQNFNKNSRRLYEHSSDDMMLGEKELELVANRLVERGDFGECHWKMAAIKQIDSTPDHVFIRLSSIRGYILPRELFSDGELESFLEELDTMRRQPPPVPAAAAGASRPASDAIRPAQPW